MANNQEDQNNIVIGTNAPVARGNVVNIQQPQADVAPPTDGKNINVADFIGKADQALDDASARQKRIEKRKALINDVILAIQKPTRQTRRNNLTNEIIAEELVYEPDRNGKSVYDYMVDPEVTKNLEFIVTEDDPQDGSPVTKPISFTWKETSFDI